MGKRLTVLKFEQGIVLADVHRYPRFSPAHRAPQRAAARRHRETVVERKIKRIFDPKQASRAFHLLSAARPQLLQLSQTLFYYNGSYNNLPRLVSVLVMYCTQKEITASPLGKSLKCDKNSETIRGASGPLFTQYKMHGGSRQYAGPCCRRPFALYTASFPHVGRFTAGLKAAPTSRCRIFY
jgi:hypothetical protein